MMRNHIKQRLLVGIMPLLALNNIEFGTPSLLLQNNLSSFLEAPTHELTFAFQVPEIKIVGESVAKVTGTDFVIHGIISPIIDGDNMVSNQSSNNTSPIINRVPTIDTGIVVPSENGIIGHLATLTGFSEISPHMAIIPQFESLPYSALIDAWRGNFEQAEAIVEERDPILLQKIEELAMCESSNRADIKIVDTNGWYSHGCLQFQYPTFKQYVRRYGIFPETSDEELLNIIGDCDVQKDLAYRMISEDPANWDHWQRCSSKLGL